MDFSYSEEQREVRELAQKILGDQTQPEHLAEIDKLEDRFDEKLWQDMESRLDNKVGVHVRRMFYSEALPRLT